MNCVKVSSVGTHIAAFITSRYFIYLDCLIVVLYSLSLAYSPTYSSARDNSRAAVDEPTND